jgi:hypothetical protein
MPSFSQAPDFSHGVPDTSKALQTALSAVRINYASFFCRRQILSSVGYRDGSLLLCIL